MPGGCACAVIEVGSPDLAEARRLELPEGQTADVLVHLKTFTDTVDDYLVTLSHDEDNRRVAALLSDRHGRVMFKEVPPGKYRVELKTKVRDDGDVSTVTLGDIMLAVSGSDAFSLGQK
ncbi:MAG TPA: hypothetical protein PLP17_07380 [Oligoflexia bacterium]|nr:hypothetical protein [Oligoflexia bacterium]